MNRIGTYLSGLCLVLLLGFVAQAVNAQSFNPYQHNYQGWDGGRIQKSTFRAFLNKFSLSLSTGYGRTFYAHDVESDLLESPEEMVMLSDFSTSGNQIIFKGVSNWLNAPVITEGTRSLSDGYDIISGDTISLGFRGVAGGIPLDLTITFDIDRFRIGGGVSAEFHHIGDLKPIHEGNYNYHSDVGTTVFSRYFLNLAAEIYNWKGWIYNGEIQVGKMGYGGKFDKSSLRRGIYFNLGIPIEYELSEYFRVFVKPSFDVKNYTINLPELEGGRLPSSVHHRQNALYVNVGVRLKLAEIPRCPIKSCQTQMKHVHWNKEFRGQPFHKEQNPKIGELYPRLYKYKNINKRKLNGGY